MVTTGATLVLARSAGIRHDRDMTVLDELLLPIVQAPMAGGPSTPDLAIAVSEVGGLGFLAAGYLTAERVREDVAAVAQGTARPFGVNVFVVGGGPADPARVAEYAGRIAPEAERAGVTLGEPRFEDDALAAKIDVLESAPVAVVSFTFGLPSRAVVDRLHAVGSELWMTVTSPEEALQAVASGADALVVQGVEAGGHRGIFTDDDTASDLTLSAALQLIAAAVDVPLVGAGAIMTGAGVAAVLAAGAAAVQLGTAYLRTPEAGTSPAQRTATASATPTALTRAFSGRLARGISNRMLREHGPHAPTAYPEVNHLTSRLRAHARAAGDPDLINLWAGQAHALAGEEPAGELTRRLAADARVALREAARRLG
jgi:nitronate monooxygenase